MKVGILHITARADVGGGPEVLLRLVSEPSCRPMYVACPNEAPYFGRFTHLLGSERVVPIPHRSFTIGTLLRLRRFVIDRNIFVLHSHGFGAGLYGRILQLLTGRPCVHTYHGFLLSGPGLLVTASRAIGEVILFPLTTVPVAVSSTERRRILRWFWWAKSRVISIPNGVSPTSTEAVKVQGDDARIRVLTVGRLVEQKAPLALPEIAQHLRERGSLDRFLFVVVGEGPLGEALRCDVRKRGVGEAFSFAGETFEPARFYKSADIYLSPSRDEAFGLAVLDAMIRGLPVVASAVNGHTDAIVHGQTGLLFSWGDWEQAAAHLHSLADDLGMREQLGSEGRQTTLEQYSAARMAARYEDCYAAVLHDNSRVEKLERTFLN